MIQQLICFALKEEVCRFGKSDTNLHELIFWVRENSCNSCQLF